MMGPLGPHSQKPTYENATPARDFWIAIIFVKIKRRQQRRGEHRNESDLNQEHEMLNNNSPLEIAKTSSDDQAAAASPISKAKTTTRPLPARMKSVEFSLHVKLDNGGTNTAVFKYAENELSGASTKTRGTLDFITVIEAMQRLGNGDPSFSTCNRLAELFTNKD